MSVPRKEILVLPDESAEYQPKNVKFFIDGVRQWFASLEQRFPEKNWATPNPSDEEILAAIDQLRNPEAIKLVKAYLRGAPLLIFSQPLQDEIMRAFMARKKITLSSIQHGIANIFEVRAIEEFQKKVK